MTLLSLYKKVLVHIVVTFSIEFFIIHTGKGGVADNRIPPYYAFSPLSYIAEQNKPTNYSFYTDKLTSLDVPDLDSGTFVYSGRHVHVRNQLLIVLLF